MQTLVPERQRMEHQLGVSSRAAGRDGGRGATEAQALGQQWAQPQPDRHARTRRPPHRTPPAAVGTVTAAQRRREAPGPERGTSRAAGSPGRGPGTRDQETGKDQLRLERAAAHRRSRAPQQPDCGRSLWGARSSCAGTPRQRCGFTAPSKLKRSVFHRKGGSSHRSSCSHRAVRVSARRPRASGSQAGSRNLM